MATPHLVGISRGRWRPQVLAIALVCLAVSLLATPSQGQAPAANIPVAEFAAYREARSAFQRNCFRCHNARGDQATRKTLDQLDMTRYPFVGRRGAVAGQVIRQALIGSASQRTMPKDDPASLSAADQALILKWTDAFDVARATKR